MKCTIRILFIFFFATGLITSACKKSNTQSNAIPYIQVSVQLNLNEPQYSKLQFVNNYVYLDNVGVKGILVLNYNNQYYALERNCPYNHFDSCARVSVITGNLQIECGEYKSNKLVPCCGSTYNFDGSVLKGPTTLPLKQYSTNYSGGVLYISN